MTRIGAQVHWSRAARTDKGVHALGNLISVKLLWPPEVDMVAEANKHLPPDICVLDMKRVTKVHVRSSYLP
jgi:tRNA pseudouridine38-40 synthase